eukprot:c25638_g1_i2 orf=215-1624(+)
MDPLSVLREYTIRKDFDSIKQVDDEFHFGNDYRFPCNIETAYRSKQGNLYTLDSLVFFVKNTLMKHTEYMQQARSLKLHTVTFTDRKPLLDYLEGRVQTTDAIELLPPAAPLLPSRDERERATVRQTEDVEEYKPDDPSYGPSKRLRLDADAVEGEYIGKEIDTSRLVNFIRERERPIRDRDTILLCHNKDFRGILTMLTKREEEKRKSDEQQKDTEKMVDVSILAPNTSNRYANVEEKTFWKEHLGTDAAEELGIDPTQSYITGFTKQKDAAKPAKLDVHIHRPVLQSSQRPPVSLSSQKARLEGPPIILVPSAFQTMLNTYNAKDFLEDGVYCPPDQKAKIVLKKPDLVTIQRKMGRDTPVKYEVRDKPTVLSPKDWDRVVAVFVLGKEWQFKDWPFKSHVEIFDKIMGIFLRFEDDSVESAKVVKQWNVKIISLSKHKRHQDKTAVLEFWDRLDAFVRSRRMNLVF